MLAWIPCPAIIIFLLTGGIYSAHYPLFQDYLHRFVQKKIRATVSSLFSMGHQLVVSVAGIIAAVFMDIVGPQMVIAVGGFFGLFAIAALMKIKN